MTQIRCWDNRCTFWEGGSCMADEMEYHPEHGCLTYEEREDYEEELEWEEEELLDEEEEWDEDEDLYYLDEDEDLEEEEED